MAALSKNGEELARMTKDEYKDPNNQYKRTLSIRSNGYVLCKTQRVNAGFYDAGNWRRYGRIKKMTPEVIEKVKKLYEKQGYRYV